MSTTTDHKNARTRTCSKCKLTQPRSNFEYVIHRRTYDVECDDDGYEHFLKITKLCLECRHKAKEMKLRLKREKQSSLIVEFRV